MSAILTWPNVSALPRGTRVRWPWSYVPFPNKGRSPSFRNVLGVALLPFSAPGPNPLAARAQDPITYRSVCVIKFKSPTEADASVAATGGPYTLVAYSDGIERCLREDRNHAGIVGVHRSLFPDPTALNRDAFATFQG